MNYSIDSHCPDCFQPSSQAICACGFNRDDYLKKEAASHHLPLFTQLGTEYVLGRVLGEGGFAVVYAAIRIEDQLAFAVKEYYPQALAKRGLDGKTINPKSDQATLESWQNRFVQEGELLRRCYDYPSVESGVVHYADLIRQHNTAYLVMERLNGLPLAHYLKPDSENPHGKKMPIQEIVFWLKPLLETLQKLHSKRIYHRDISPNNIFLCSPDKPVLMDFGLARSGVRESLHLSTTLGAGTFIAPEQLNGGRCDQRTDLYSLGAVIYLCLHGNVPPPIDARRQGAILQKVKQEDRESLALQNMAATCLELDIAKRPQDVGQLLFELVDCWEKPLSPFETIVPLNAKVEALESELESIKADKQALEEEIVEIRDVYRLEKVKANDETAKLKNELQSLQGVKKDLDQQIEQLGSYWHTRLQKAETELAKVTVEKERFLQQLTLAQSETESLKQQPTSSELALIKNLQQQLLDANSEINSLRKKTSELPKLKGDKEKLARQLLEVNREIRDLKYELTQPALSDVEKNDKKDVEKASGNSITKVIGFFIFIFIFIFLFLGVYGNSYVYSWHKLLTNWHAWIIYGVETGLGLSVLAILGNLGDEKLEFGFWIGTVIIMPIICGVIAAVIFCLYMDWELFTQNWDTFVNRASQVDTVLIK